MHTYLDLFHFAFFQSFLIFIVNCIFLPLYVLFLFLTLNISPPSVLSKAFFLPLISSHSNFLFFSFLNPSHIYKWWLAGHGYYGYHCSSSTVFLLVHYFLYFKSHRLFSPSYSILLSPCPGLFELVFFSPSLAWTLFLTLTIFFSHDPLRMIFLYL